MVNELFIEATNRCNGRCLFCWHDRMKYTKGYASPELYSRLLEEVNPKRIWVHLAGEPTLHPELPRIVENCGGRAAMVTNGALLGTSLATELLEAEISWIIVTVVSADQENYRKINGLDATQVYENVARLWWMRTQGGYRTRLTVRFTVCEENEHEVDVMKKFWGAICDDIHMNPEFRVPHLKDRKIWRNLKLNCLLARKLSRTGVVKWDGQVVPCCRDLDAWHPMGNVYDSSFQEIYEGRTFRLFREAMLTDEVPNICQDCYIHPSRWFKKLWRG